MNDSGSACSLVWCREHPSGVLTGVLGAGYAAWRSHVRTTDMRCRSAVVGTTEIGFFKRSETELAEVYVH